MAEQKEEKSPTVPLVHLRIVSAEKYIFSDYVAYVEVEGVEGGIGIKPGHSPLLKHRMLRDPQTQLLPAPRKSPGYTLT